MGIKIPIEERLNSRIEVIGDCWLWTGKLDKDGYPMQMKVDGKMLRPHRIMYAMHKGEIPKGLTLDHLCRVRKCVNPDHLEAVTSRINTQRGERATATHCKNGHEFTGFNLVKIWNSTDQRWSRRCRECLNAYHREYNQSTEHKHSKAYRARQKG